MACSLLCSAPLACSQMNYFDPFLSIVELIRRQIHSDTVVRGFTRTQW